MSSQPLTTPSPLPAGLSTKDKVILFDGHCLLCSGWVHFVIKRDPNALFTLCSVQSTPGKEILAWNGIDPENCDTMAYMEEGLGYLRSTAFLRAVRHFPGWGWRVLSAVGLVFPAWFRDFIYHRIAKNRYRLFGHSDACMMPTPEIRSRFLE